jgi:HD-GYP domain-containing protein (c-di-GMP phosphodiesterase class II)
MQRVTRYVIGIAVLAAVTGAALTMAAPVLDVRQAEAAVYFAILGLLAHLLSYSVGQVIGGSSAFLPFLTAAVLAPTWIGCAAITSAVLASGLALKGPTIKTFFNVAQSVLAIGAGILVYRALGGEALITSPKNIPAYIGLVLTFATVNTVAVSGVVAVSERRSVMTVISESTIKTIGYDILSVPFVFLFATVYINWGFVGVAGLAIPLLGLRQLYKVNWQLEQSHQELLEMMVANLEARDPYTSGHSRRVARNAKIIGRALGLSSKQVERVGVAALLHDVGKIHEVFAPLLRKPDRLTPDEWAIMETHPIKSAELVAKVSQLKDVVGSVRHHHENWDGSGYPDGLAGEEIPLGARIIMFADTTDAMTTDRPYRAAMSPQQVRDEFLRQRGRQFDPDICDRLLSSPQFALLFVDPSKQGTPPFFPRLERVKKAAV